MLCNTKATTTTVGNPMKIWTISISSNVNWVPMSAYINWVRMGTKNRKMAYDEKAITRSARYQTAAECGLDALE